MKFEELVCYSQTVILIILGIGYIVNLRNKVDKPKSKAENKCPLCGYIVSNEKVNYCGKCGNMLSHSEGLSLNK